ncbi:MAG: TonB-dependent receptor [Pseudomonadales bacterium]|jgi:outer membrane receptor protein involved in Fe transport|nr:TonB-dependent receptor [Pseudomonadales bacterium]
MNTLFIPESVAKKRYGVAGVLVALLCLPRVALAAEEGRVRFTIPEQRADRSLTAFARQAGLSVLFPFDEVSGITTNKVEGTFVIETAMKLLLDGTGLVAEIKAGERLTVHLARAGEQAGGKTAAVTSAAASSRSAASSSVIAAEKPASARLEEVVVTGSRIRRDGFNSAVPTTVLGSDMLQALNIRNMGDALGLVPANLSNWSPTAKPGGNKSVPLNVFNGLNLANLRGLNPVYGSRTLTLVDSRRHIPTNQGDGVDMNMLPAILIDHIEIVTGGVSASYGSGAIGGAVNLLLDHHLDGLKVDANYGATTQGDGRDRYYGVAWGGQVGQSGRLILGVETQLMDSVDNCIETRTWCARGASLRENLNYASNGAPNFVYRENVRSDMSARGVLPLLGKEFNVAGTAVVPYQHSDAYQVGGSGQHIYLDTTLRTNVERQVGYLSYDYRPNPDSHLFVEAGAGQVQSWTPQDGIDLFNARLQPDNFYLNALEDNPCAAMAENCLLNKDFSAQVQSVNATKTALRRLSVGAGGRFGASSWTWDGYYQQGRSEMKQVVYNTRHALRMLLALDAVDDGTGHPICRATRDGLAADFDGDPRLAEGCAPLNLFGTGAIEAPSYDYSWGSLSEDSLVRQNMAELVVSGKLFQGYGSGPWHGAVGWSWRDETLDNLADTTQPDYIRTDYNSQYGESFGGRVEVAEHFAELEVPLTRSADLQFATRRSFYKNTAGMGTGVEGHKSRYDITTWKANGSWDVSDWLRLRASRSRDMRAPNFRELYYGKVFSRGGNFGYCGNPWTGNHFDGWYTFTGDPCRAELHGNLDLGPERSDTTTFGFALNPARNDLRLAVDYYAIKIQDAISPGSWFSTIDQCYLQRDPASCALIEGPLLNPDDPLGGFSRLDVASSKSQNLRSYASTGLDVVFDLTRSFKFGTLATRLLASHTLAQWVQPTQGSPALQNIAGVSGTPNSGADWEPAPRWSAQWFTTLTRGPIGITVQAKYVSAGLKNAAYIGPGQDGFAAGTQNSIDDNRVPSYLIWGLNAAYDIGLNVGGLKTGSLKAGRAQLFASIQNLFDKDPPLIGTGIGGTNPVLFDTVGRRYEFGMRARF